jgi:hypothetical protein
LFFCTDIIEEYLVDTFSASPESGVVVPERKQKKTGFKLDAFIPRARIAFEYDGEQHFQDRGGLRVSPSRMRNRDEAKRALSAALGIRIISVDFKWDGKKESLKLLIDASVPEAAQ